MSIRKRIRTLLLVALLVVPTAVVLGAEQVNDEPDTHDNETAGAVASDPAPEPDGVDYEPMPEPELEIQPTPQPTPTPEPDILTARPTPTPTPAPAPAPGPTPTPEPTPEPRDPPYPIACGDTEPVDDPELTALILEALGAHEDRFSVVVHELTTGARAEVNADRSYYGASLFKTAIMYEVFRQVEDGRLSLDQRVTFDDYYAAQDLGTLHLLGWTIGTEVTLGETLEAMIIISDNASAVLLGDLVGWETLDETLAGLGAIDTEFSSLDLPTTAADTEVILRAIACAEGVTWTSSQKMLEILARQMVVNRLPRDMPEGTIVAHKTGNWHEANHDAGIVYGPEAIYIIVIMSTYPPGADDTMAQLNRAVFDYFHPAEMAEAHEASSDDD